MRKIRGNEISMIFQEPMTSLNPVFTIGEQIAEVFRVHRKMNRAQALDASAEMLERVRIPEPRQRLGEYPHQLSGGMRQRVMIAMALACDPKVLIADEPTTALDVTVQAQILALVEQLKSERNAAVILITHDLGVIAEVAARVAVMYAGQVVEMSPVEALFGQPLHPYTEGLLRSIPGVGGAAKERLDAIGERFLPRRGIRAGVDFILAARSDSRGATESNRNWRPGPMVARSDASFMSLRISENPIGPVDFIMIPVSLYLRNFLSYGEAAGPLDFSGFRLACLSGPNGHGKSALLDAMTWALWGQARKASGAGKPDDALIRIGAGEMLVEFVFDLSGERYRASRGYELRKSGRGKSDLQFDVFDVSRGGYRPLTCKTLTETQKRIEQILGMDYTTFINSSFLLQGRADEFTRKKPSERKEILAEVLGLRRYEELRELARQRARNYEKELLQASGRMEAIRRDLEAKPEAERRLEALSNRYREQLEQTAQWEAGVKDLQDRKSRIESLRIQFEEGGKRAESQRGKSARRAPTWSICSGSWRLTGALPRNGRRSRPASFSWNK
jgi:ABC-type dipeptide/oligopeptide/nickel transport system ATPase subunit